MRALRHQLTRTRAPVTVSVVGLVAVVLSSASCGDGSNPSTCPVPAGASMARALVATSEGVLNLSSEQIGFRTDRKRDCYTAAGVTLSNAAGTCQLVFNAEPGTTAPAEFEVNEVRLNAWQGCPGLPADVVGTYILRPPAGQAMGSIETFGEPYRDEASPLQRACLDWGPQLRFPGGTFELEDSPIDGQLERFEIFEFEHSFAGPLPLRTGRTTCD